MLSSRFTPLTLKRRDTTGTAAQFGGGTEAVVQYSRGFIQPVSGGETLEFLRVDDKATHRLYCPVELLAQYGDIIEQSGQRFIVVYADQPNGITGFLFHKEILLQRYAANG